jgi:peptidoglycan/xylan/chitin deacetylase (PgdA/CDA1 family)
MFLKRSLVLVIGVLLFIGAFLLFFKMRDAGIEKNFRQTREDYGVQGTVLTAAQPSFAVASAPPPAPAQPPPPTTDTEATPPPGAAPDTNTIIGPVPPSSTPDNSTPPATDNGPAPAASTAPGDMSGGAVSPNADGTTPSTNTDSMPVPPAPSTDTSAPSTDTNSVPAPSTPNTDTNSTPMTPSSTMVSPRAAIWASLLIGATETNVTPAPAPAMEAIPAPPAVPVATNAATTKAVPASTNTAPASVTAVAPAGLPPRAAVASDRAIVLGYHQFTGPGAGSKNIYSMSQDVFAGEMKYLRDNGYNVVPLSAVVKFIEHKGTLPPNAIAITIDDGYKSAINYAAPVLKQYGYPWTFFVYPEFITRTESKGAASWPDLVELQNEGVDVECHSMTHPQLTSHTQKFRGPRHTLTPEEYDAFLTDETVDAKAILEKELGKPVEYFAYPYGAYNQTVEAKAVAAGFEAIFTVADNPVHITTNVHRIGRYIITKPVEKMFASYLRQGALSLAQVSPEPGAIVSNPEPVITAVLGFSGDPKTIETEVRDYGVVKHDFDPATSTIRLYLPRPLIQPEVLVSIRARDTQSGQIMVANWTFNYEPAPGEPPSAHPPIGVPANEPAPGPEGTTNAASTNPGPVMPGAPTATHAGP